MFMDVQMCTHITKIYIINIFNSCPLIKRKTLRSGCGVGAFQVY